MNKNDDDYLEQDVKSLAINNETEKNEIQVSKNKGVSVLNAIFSCFVYLSIYISAAGSVGIEPADSIIHWGMFIVSILFAILFFNVLKKLSSISFGISKNISLQNIALAVVCAITVIIINYALNVLILQKLLKSSYEFMVASQQELKPLSVIIYICLLAPIGEELLFRGYILNGLRNKYKTNTALLITSVLFAIYHVYPASIINALTMGIIIGLFYIKKESVFACMIAHVLYNIIAMYVTNNYVQFF